ncbi:MAG: hypothetical protein LBC41_08750 [Clostridiales bacterium]|nr:hypothetical protein [Clostridiales bacterium]MDR2750734.1 hypothetical protein [Clostridiales bacterium]
MDAKQENTAANVPEKAEIPKGAVVYGKLKDWDMGGFLPITEGTGIYYGGWQGWLVDEGVTQFYADRSCGVTASSNMLAYTAKHDPQKAKLYTKPDMSKKSFSQYQKEVYEFVSPAAWGVPTVDALAGRVVKFAESKGVKLTPHIQQKEWKIENVRPYMTSALNLNKPVLLLTWNSPVKDLEMHWITVTAYFKDQSEKILVSNWGAKRIYDFSTWFSGNSMYKGLVYFD